MKNAGRYLFVTDCIGSTYEDISKLKETESAVSLETFRLAIGLEQWKRLLEELGYDRDFPISRDWHVGYYKGIYRGVPAYFLRHSGIEHIFTLEGRQARWSPEAPRRRMTDDPLAEFALQAARRSSRRP